MSKKRRQPVIDFTAAKEKSFRKQKPQQVSLIPKNTAQEHYISLLNNKRNKVVFAIGPAGTGKTYIAVLHAIIALKRNAVSKIIITRPAVSSDEQHGFLPGDLNQKMEPWTRPLMDTFEEYYSTLEIQDMLADRTIEICPLAYMRGRTFKNAYVILDEAQNTTPEQMKMFLTRLGKYSYSAVTGDADQHDRGFERNGLLDFLDRLNQKPSDDIGLVKFANEHVERSDIVKSVLNIYDDTI